MRPGEVAVPLPEHADAAIYFIGRIRTPWPTRSACPKRGDPVTGPACAIEVDDPWRPALRAIGRHPRLQILYWMHLARRDLVLQNPRSDGVLIGTFAIRSPVRPNPIASSLVTVIGLEESRLLVRGLDCVDGTPLLDIKPEHCLAAGSEAAAAMP
ncbi:MAG: SAM-dependent methyltransferase [Rhizobiales bacterium]|nr:SAM-dependent methyltransferase [Hyphomicrobiales bacterium]MBN9010128.1 SAM-dependent methyltransferase [Hyphomicrobiales bacterium]